MRVVLDSGETLDLGETEATPTISIVDYSRRVTDDYGVTTVVERGFARRMSVNLVVAFGQTDALERNLAAIRAKPARWIADEGVDWLDFRGFYKDFEVNLPVPPKSYCTLTVEALTATEAFADPGGDPAPFGQASTLQLLQPATIAGGALVASTVPENDYPEWAAGTTYPLGARVIKAATHRIYESGSIGNVGNDPVGVSGKWRDIGPTNRWAMFDQALGSTTEAPGQITVTLAAGAINAAALLDVKAATVRVVANGYDRTLAPNASGTVTFLDMPETAGQVTVVITGPGTVEVGTLLVGKLVGLGATTDDAKAGITDFSRKEADEFGDIQVVERAWAKRMTLPAKLRRDAIDLVAGRIAAVRAKPSLWIGKEGMETLTVFGFFKDFSIAVDTTICTLSLSIEGLSTAGKVEPLAASVDWPDVGDPAGTKPEDNATVGAPAGTDVAGKPAEEVVGQLEEQELALDQLDLDVAQATINIAAAQATIAQMQTDAVATKAELEADIASLNATADQIQTDAAGTRAALATAQADILAAGGRINTIESTLGDQGASISSLSQTVSNHTGRLASIDTTLSANGASINQNAQAISAVQGDLASLSSTVATQGASITQNAQAITTANQNIASLTTSLKAGSPNLLQNGGFENGLANWSQQAGSWGVNSGANAAYGTHATCIPPTGTVYLQSEGISAVPGKAYTVSGRCRLTGGGAGSYAYFDMIFTNSSGAVLPDPGDGPIYLPGAQFDDVGNRENHTFTAIAPATTAKVFVRAVGVNAGGVTQVAFQQLKLEIGSTATSYSPEASIVQTFSAISTTAGQVASLSTTVSAQGTSITQNATAISTLSGTVSSLSTTVSGQGASISSLQSASNTQAGQIATLQTRVVAGGGNLLSNTEFASGLSGWSYGAIGQTGINFGINLAGASYQVAGTNAATIQQTNTSSSGYAELTQDVPAEAGKIFELSSWYGAHRCLVSIYAVALDANSASLGQVGSAVNLPQVLTNGKAIAGWSRVYFKTSAAPANTAFIRVFLRKLATSTGTTDSWAWFLRPQIIETTTDTPSPQRYAAGTERASIELQATALATLNTQYASLSSTVSTQGSSISTMQTAITTLTGDTATLKTQVSAGGGNLLTNTEFAGGLAGWTFPSGSLGSATSYARNGAGAEYIVTNTIAATMYYAGTDSAGYSDLTQVIPITGGKHYDFSVWYAAHRCNVQCYLQFKNAAGTVTNTPNSGTWGPMGGGTSLSGWNRIAFKAQADPSAVSVTVYLRKFGSLAGNSDSWAWFLKPQVCETLATSAAGLAYSPGDSRAAIESQGTALSTLNTQYASLSSTVSTQGVTITNQQTAITSINGNITSLMGRWGVEIDVNGYVSGVTTNNNGTRADFTIRADKFAIVSPGGGARTEYSNGNWRVYNAAGVLKVQLGVNI